MAMRLILGLVGALSGLVGMLWVGQGLGYIGGSFMTGQPEWVRNGAIALAAGLLLLYAGLRPRR